MSDGYVLGIDTSNYTTSVALTDAEGNVVHSEERLLEVKVGERGLRQSDAFYKHAEALPEMLGFLKDMRDEDGVSEIKALAVSTKPRPVEGSYMPVFKAGMSFAKVIAQTLDVPLYEFSHQEGHIEAVKHYSSFQASRDIIVFHLSGGTSEILKVREKESGYGIEIIGRSRDISFGQLIDRVGVAMGMPFPAGKMLDEAALAGELKRETLNPIKIKGLEFNLSGIETQALRLSASGEEPGSCLFERISECISELTQRAITLTGTDKVLYVGGVANSDYIRKYISERFEGAAFGKYSSDNAVGISLLGGRLLWR